VLPQTLEEGSGLLFYNDKLISFNDSGNLPNLYELDTITNQITRTIQVANATNVDWEDIAQDENYIYIGDFGNNLGDRTDLKIYIIDKTAYLNNTSVTADVIEFSYNNQTDFTPDNQTNFDAEAMVVVDNNIHIFTKNHGDLNTSDYVLSKTIGNHTAVLNDTFNINGLVTGATYNEENNTIFLCGYSPILRPFLSKLKHIDNAIFSEVTTYLIYSDISYNQIEGIAYIDDNHYFISSEKFVYNSVTILQKLFSFDDADSVNTVNDLNTTIHFDIYPNPVLNTLFIKSDLKPMDSITITNSNGKIVFEKEIRSSFYNLDIPQSLEKGLYFVTIKNDYSTATQKIIVQ